MTAIDVLVADDDEDTRVAMVTALTALDYRCRSAPDGRAALEEHEREAAAIVITDWGMPHLDGLQLCHALKKQALPPYVILMTTVPARALLFDAIRHGADQFLRKPFDLDELEVRLLAAARLMSAIRARPGANLRLERRSALGSRLQSWPPLATSAPRAPRLVTRFHRISG